MAVPPVKLKAFVASLREQVLDADEGIWKPCFVALVQLEFAQHGVWIDDIDDAKTKIFLALQSTAGKLLLFDASSYPKPLLAGSSAMAGKLAERAASPLQTAAGDGTPGSNILGGSMKWRLPKDGVVK